MQNKRNSLFNRNEHDLPEPHNFPPNKRRIVIGIKTAILSFLSAVTHHKHDERPCSWLLSKKKKKTLTSRILSARMFIVDKLQRNCKKMGRYLNYFLIEIILLFLFIKIAICELHINEVGAPMTIF